MYSKPEGESSKRAETIGSDNSRFPVVVSVAALVVVGAGAGGVFCFWVGCSASVDRVASGWFRLVWGGWL